MYFYRELNAIFALSFDFDDTLYDNRPIIARAERESLLFLRNYHPTLCNIRQVDCDRMRFWLCCQEPDICHDVTYWRWKSLQLMLFHAGLSKYEACSGADFAMDVMIRWRSQFNLSIEVQNILLALADKWPLVAITNGNVDPVSCGLEGYFDYIFRAGRDGKSKPYGDMYHLAAKKLGLPVKNFLHVGDNLEVDVKGALIAGMQACWINQHVCNLSMSFCRDKVVNTKYRPHLKISSLFSLTNLL